MKSKDLIKVYSVAPLLLFAALSGFLCVKRFWNAPMTIVATLLGVALMYLLGCLKYRQVKSIAFIPFWRCAIFDPSFLAAAFVLNWFYVYFPIPFSIEAFNKQFDGNDIEIPIHILLLILFLIPTILTNKKIESKLEEE